MPTCVSPHTCKQHINRPYSATLTQSFTDTIGRTVFRENRVLTLAYALCVRGWCADNKPEHFVSIAARDCSVKFETMLQGL